MVQGRADREPGGALHVPRERQGAGRHDYPDAYGAIYVSRSALSAVAERIQGFRGQQLGDRDLRFASGARLALARIDDAALDGLLDLDDPAVLLKRGLRPSQVATHNRSVTRRIAHQVFSDGASGFLWWSSLEATWTNVTLFAERALDRLVLAGQPEPLTLRNDAMKAAAEAIGVRLSA